MAEYCYGCCSILSIEEQDWETCDCCGGDGFPDGDETLIEDVPPQHKAD
jgi:hypothetical protein